MADAMSNYLASQLLNLVLRNEQYSQPNGDYLWVGLFTDTALLDGGALTDEISAGDYSRVQINRQTGRMFTASSNGSVVQNSSDIVFSTATTDWAPTGSEVTAAALLDASTGGNILIWGALAAAKEIVTGDQFKILSGDFKIQFS